MVQNKAVMATQRPAEFRGGAGFGLLRLLQPASFETIDSGLIQQCGIGGLEAFQRQLEIAGQNRLDFLA